MAMLLPFNKVFPNGVAMVPRSVTWLSTRTTVGSNDSQAEVD